MITNTHTHSDPAVVIIVVVFLIHRRVVNGIKLVSTPTVTHVAAVITHREKERETQQ